MLGCRAYLTPIGVAAALLLACGLAAAQTSYKAVELKRPIGVGVSACDHARPVSLGDNGDVAVDCAYITGFTFNSSLGFIPIPTSTHKPVVWRSGGSPVALPLPSGFELKRVVGVDGRGRVLGQIGPTKISAPSQSQYTLAWWEGGKRTAWMPPIVGLGYQWVLSEVSPSGKFAAATLGASATPRLVVIDGSTVNDLPLPGVPGRIIVDLSVNDRGQIAVHTEDSAFPNSYAPAQLWVWNGSAWAEVTPTERPFSLSMALLNINASGQVLVGDQQYNSATGQSTVWRYVWQQGSGASVVSQETSIRYPEPYDAMLASNGDVVTTDTLNNTPSMGNADQRRAVIYRNGQRIDLNTVAPAVSGYLYDRLLAENGKGQLLAHMTNSVDSSKALSKLMLLTLK